MVAHDGILFEIGGFVVVVFFSRLAAYPSVYPAAPPVVFLPTDPPFPVYHRKIRTPLTCNTQRQT